MIWFRFVFWPVLLIACAIMLFQVKHNARKVERQSASITREITKTKASIKVLEAEWSTLNQPGYLAALAGHYLDYDPENRTRIVNISDLPMIKPIQESKSELETRAAWQSALDREIAEPATRLKPGIKPSPPVEFEGSNRDGLRTVAQEDALADLISEIGASE